MKHAIASPASQAGTQTSGSFGEHLGVTDDAGPCCSRGGVGSFVGACEFFGADAVAVADAGGAGGRVAQEAAPKKVIASNQRVIADDAITGSDPVGNLTIAGDSRTTDQAVLRLATTHPRRVR